MTSSTEQPVSGSEQTLTITDFLLARIAEDAERAAMAVGRGIMWGLIANGVAAHDHASGLHVLGWSPARVLDECEAKRRIVEFYEDAVDDLQTGREGRVPASRAYDTLRALASAYANHADWREEWGA